MLGKGLLGDGSGGDGRAPSDPTNSNRPSTVSGVRRLVKARLLTPDLGDMTSEPCTSERSSDPISTGSGADDGDRIVPASVTAPDGVTDDTMVQRCGQACGDVGALPMAASPGTAAPPLPSPDGWETSGP